MSWFPRTAKAPTPLEAEAVEARREADSAFADRKDALRAAARRLGIAVDAATERLIDTMETVAK